MSRLSWKQGLALWALLLGTPLLPGVAAAHGPEARAYVVGEAHAVDVWWYDHPKKPDWDYFTPSDGNPMVKVMVPARVVPVVGNFAHIYGYGYVMPSGPYGQ